LLAQDADALRAAQQPIKLIQHTDAAPGECRQSRACHAELRERSPAENEARIENQVDDVGDPQQAHGYRGIAGSAKNCVVEKQQHNGAAAA